MTTTSAHTSRAFDGAAGGDSSLQRHHRIDPPLMRALVWTGIGLVAFTAIGFAGFMHMVPAPAPSASANDTLRWVQQHRTSMLIGAAMVTFFWAFWTTWCAPLVIYIRRMENAPLLTYASLGTVGAGGAVITMIAVSWTVMAFRGENPLIVQAFNDLAWFLFLYTWPGFGILMVIIGLAVLRDVNPSPTFPRWVAWYNFYAAFAMVPASFIGLFKHGPLAWNGALSFWLVVLDFFIWMVVMSVVLFRRIRLDAVLQSGGETQGTPGYAPGVPLRTESSGDES